MQESNLRHRFWRPIAYHWRIRQGCVLKKSDTDGSRLSMPTTSGLPFHCIILLDVAFMTNDSSTYPRVALTERLPTFRLEVQAKPRVGKFFNEPPRCPSRTRTYMNIYCLRSQNPACFQLHHRAITFFYKTFHRGGYRNRTGLNGFADRCLNHSANPPKKIFIRASCGTRTRDLSLTRRTL